MIRPARDAGNGRRHAAYWTFSVVSIPPVFRSVIPSATCRTNPDWRNPVRLFDSPSSKTVVLSSRRDPLLLPALVPRRRLTRVAYWTAAVIQVPPQLLRRGAMDMVDVRN